MSNFKNAIKSPQNIYHSCMDLNAILSNCLKKKMKTKFNTNAKETVWIEIAMAFVYFANFFFLLALLARLLWFAITFKVERMKIIYADEFWLEWTQRCIVLHALPFAPGWLWHILMMIQFLLCIFLFDRHLLALFLTYLIVFFFIRSLCVSWSSTMPPLLPSPSMLCMQWPLRVLPATFGVLRILFRVTICHLHLSRVWWLQHTKVQPYDSYLT